MKCCFLLSMAFVAALPAFAAPSKCWARGHVGGVALIGIDPKTKQATAVGPAAGRID